MLIRYVIVSVISLVIVVISIVRLFVTSKRFDVDEDNKEKFLANSKFQNHLRPDLLLYKLAQIASLPPPVPPDPDCRPPPIKKTTTCAGETGLIGTRRKEPRKVVMMILFGFEADILEIMLKDSLDLLDFLFIVESTRTHKGKKKPLMWERLKFSERFSFVDPAKVVHIVVDDRIDNKKETEKDMWFPEISQTSVGVERIKDWSNKTGHLNEDDIFISADVDEVMSRSALQKLRWCDITGPLISGSLWMPLGSLTRAHKSDFPVAGKPHTFGLPTIYRWDGVARGKYDGSRLQVKFPLVYRGPRDKYVMGGIHMTYNSFLPTALLKELTGTEMDGFMSEEFLSRASLKDLNDEQDILYGLDNKPFWAKETDSLDFAKDVEHYVPWFLACNPARFPYWYGKPDPRNLQTIEAFHVGK